MRLSKSRLLSYLQCPKRLWLAIHRPGLAEVTPATQALFETGHRVGEIARTLYAQGRSVYIGYSKDLTAALNDTQLLLFPPTPAEDAGPSSLSLAEQEALIPTLYPEEGETEGRVFFEATFEHQGVLVRADILERSPLSTRLIEVKSATEMKEEYVADVAIQTWVLEGAGVHLNEVALAHVNNEFTYRGDGDYAGLLKEEPVGDLAGRVAHQVPAWSRDAQRILAGPEPAIAIGQRCRTPHDCPFIAYCWPETEYPLTALPGLGRKLDEYVARGYRDVRDVPEREVSGETRLRVWRATITGRAEIQRALRGELRAIPYPRYYLDFETVSFAVPIWSGTRPYQAIPFQWSIHVEKSPGELEHAEYLDLSGELPAREVARRLLAALAHPGPILTYSDYERRCIETLAELVPLLADLLRALEPRIVDLLPILRRNYYHPAMRGSWSIKAVLPTAVPDLRYEDLGEVREGDAAQRAYLEAIGPTTTPARKAAIEESLREYCRFDTLAMARLVGQFTRPAG